MTLGDRGREELMGKNEWTDGKWRKKGDNRKKVGTEEKGGQKERK